MERIWLKSYEPGVPAEIDLSEYRSLVDMFEKSVARFRDRVAYINMRATLTYGEVEESSRRFAAYLQSVLKLPRGSRVALMMPNVLQYPVCMIGALRAGCVVVNCNPMFTPRELQYQLADSGAETIVILESFAHTLQEAIGKTSVKHVIVTRLGDMLGFPKGIATDFALKYLMRKVPAWRLPGFIKFKTVLSIGRGCDFRTVELAQDDLAFLQYTGGTTGLCKGAMLTHGNMLANQLQAYAWVRSALSEDGELMVTALPLYHIFAMTANCFLMIKIGASNLLITNPRDIAAFVSELAGYRFSLFTGVNTLFNALLNNEHFCKLDFSGMKVSLGGGTSVQRAVAERWKKVTGKPLIEAYGLTETSPAVTVNPLTLAGYNGSIGLPIPSTEVAIRDDNGRDLPLGEVGELCVRGPQVMKGYFNQADETANVFLPDGFLRTGDIAVMCENGYLRLVDRKKDMILVSGFNVYPNEIEDVVAMIPGIVEVAAIGIPEEKTGEAVKIFVVSDDPALTQDRIIAFCRKNLTRYKVPKQVEFRSELPKTMVGKILRRALRDEASKP